MAVRTSLSDFNTLGSTYSGMTGLETQGTLKQGAQLLPSSKCVGFWKINETSGTSAADTSMWVRGRFNGALSFDSVDDYVNCGSGASIDDIFTGGGTIEAWIYVKSDGEGDAGLIMGKYLSNGQGWSLRTKSEASGKVKLQFIHVFTSSNGEWTTTSTVVPTNQWTHVAVTYNKDATTNDPIIYVDSASVGITEDVAPTGTAQSDAANSLMIGGNGDGNGSFDGSICDVRVWADTRTATEISDNYTSQLVGNETDLQAYYKMDDGTGTSITDSTSNANTGTFNGANTGTINGTPSFNRTGIRGRGSTLMDFDDADNDISISDSDSLDIIDNLTIQTWVNLDSLTDASYIISKDTNMWNMIVNATTGTIQVAKADVATLLTSASALTTGQWYHLMYTRSGSAHKFYINGTLDKETSDATAFVANANGVRIGSEAGAAGTWTDGIIQNVMILGKVITPEDPEYDGPTPKPIDRGVTANTVAYWKLQETSGTTADNAEGTASRDGTISGATLNKVGILDKCFDFDGTDDYVQITDAAEFDITGDLTVEAWVSPDSGAQSKHIVSKWGGTNSYLLQQHATNGFEFHVHNGTSTTSVQSTFLPQVGKWYHLAGVHDDTANLLRLYVNGVQVATTSFSSTIQVGTTNIRIGSEGNGGAGSYFDGRISHVRISNAALTPNQFLMERSSIYLSDWIDTNSDAITNPKLSWTETISDTGTDVEMQLRTSQNNPIDSNTMAHWSFEDDLADAGPHKLTSSIQSTTHFTTGKSGRGIAFNGSSDYILVTDSGALRPTNLTLECWIYPKAITGNHRIIHRLNATGGSMQGYSLLVRDNAGSKNLYYEHATGASTITSVNFNYPFVVDTWYYIAATYDGTDVRLYVNGRLIGKGALGAITYGSATQDMNIGRNTTASEYFNGIVDEIRISKTARSASDLLYRFADFKTRRSTTSGTTEDTDIHRYHQIKVHAITNNT